MKPNSDQPERNPAADDEQRWQSLFRATEPPYLDDAGFTARVVGRLPASRARRARRRLVLVGSAAVLGGAIVAPLAGAELLEAGGALWAVVREWSLHPVPLVGPAFTLGSLAVLLVAAAVGWWSSARE